MSRELLQQALNALRSGAPLGHAVEDYEYRHKVIKDIEVELAKPEPVVSFTDNEEGLCIQLACDGSYHWQNLSENEAAEFFVKAYRGRK
jgi:hypothetical protein